MSKLISLDYAINQLEMGEIEMGGIFETDSYHVKEFLSVLPIAGAIEVVHGKWYVDKSFMPFISTCSECGAIYDIDGAFDWNYCPNCGAKMNVGVEYEKSDLC